MEALLLIAAVGVLATVWYILRARRTPWVQLGAATGLFVLAWVAAGSGPIGPRIVVSAVALSMVIDAVRHLRHERLSQPPT